MSNDLELVGGIYPKIKTETTPDFVLSRLSINVAQFREWMKAYLAANPGEEWINIDTLVSKGGKPYAKVDTWKPDPNMASNAAPSYAPQGQPMAAVVEDDIPF